VRGIDQHDNHARFKQGKHHNIRIDRYRDRKQDTVTGFQSVLRKLHRNVVNTALQFGVTYRAPFLANAADKRAL
jgi:carbohydrate-selective porin OprB